MIRLKSLYVKDFRSIDGEVSVSLDAPIILIHGPNGAGKTSLMSAIELALTGSVSSLSRADPDYMAFLPHKDRPFGEVRLEVIEGDQAVRTAHITVTASNVSGTPILSATDANFFSERSYLAQSTLGRLLEIYQHAEKKADSPLTRFVKELLGLDHMEALIDGLHSAGNISRLKASVPAYHTTRDEIRAGERALEELGRLQTEALATIEALERSLRDDLTALHPTRQEEALEREELANLLLGDSDEAEFVSLVRARREADVSQASLASATILPGEAERLHVAAANDAAHAALENWLRENGDYIGAVIGRAAALFADNFVASEVEFARRATLLGARINADVSRVEQVLAKHELALERRGGLIRQADEAKARLARLDDEITQAAATNDSIAQNLASLSTHIHGDTCPVCDRDFSEISATPLAAYIAGKVAGMIEQAGRLQSLLRSRAHADTEVARLNREVLGAAADVIASSELNSLKTREANLREVASQLTEAMPYFNRCDHLRRQVSDAAQALISLQYADQSTFVLQNSLTDLARRLGITPLATVSTTALLAAVRYEIETREKELLARQTVRQRAREMTAELNEARRKLSDIEVRIHDATKQLDILQKMKAKADAVIEVAKALARQTRKARGEVVRRVFNDELNALWRDLFVRLAPDEPFIPAFAMPEDAAGDIEAVLETHHRRGGKGGNPRAMLSAGNLNTAALTLFLALHLSVKAKLPWLVIDDPVQSMDEVHIAQFAALLRTLAKQMQRQVVIAVHERSLFDYLALELSPAFDGDRLNVIELGRSALGTTTSRWDAKIYVRDRAIAA